MAGYLQYDERNGQVYVETSVPVRSMVSSWLKKSTGRKEDPAKHRNRGVTGASSLYETALRSCAWHIDLFEPEALVCAEWSYAEKIYQHLKSKDAVTIKNWALYHKAFPGSKDLQHTFALPIGAKAGSHPHELEPIQKHLASLPIATLTNLDVRNLSLRATHLMNLLDFPNLSVLVLEQSRELSKSKDDGGISDSFMRRWGRAVFDAKAFTRLRVIVFRNFQTSLDDTFLCFTVFPSLVLCNLDSWWAKQDMMGMLSGGLVGKNRRWKHVPTEGPDAQGRGKNPETTWRRSDKTIHEKMEMLYKLAGDLVPRPGHHTPTDPIVSIHYGDASHYHDPKSYSAWFMRVIPTVDDYALRPPKRPSLEGNAAAAEPTYQPKKKSVKTGKKQDIGALLGAFA
ncbi:hypothetical protein CC80DRAFT_59669 [Byssothecium circinans]|uniref:Uncharacterized protein n=1 Tax=Byssothecium circinans TaxID=147558 RepID=A0A6A5U0K2_9PLEO|nr:hypothetical protein CC80DRAFT_59669 [Byssothecium circinans]